MFFLENFMLSVITAFFAKRTDHYLQNGNRYINSIESYLKLVITI